MMNKMKNMRKLIIGFGAFMFLLTNVAAAKLPSGGYIPEYNDDSVVSYEEQQLADMHDLLTRENASYEDLYADYVQRTPFEEEIAMQTMAGPPDLPGGGAGDLYAPVPCGLLSLIAFAGLYAARLFRKKRQSEK